MPPDSQQPAPPRDARRVLVTGGAGFIGSHLTDLLLAGGDRVTVIDDLSTGRRENLPASHPRLDFRQVDLGRGLADLPAGTRFDRVYHLAAAVGVKLVMDQPIRSMETNIEQTARLLRFVAAAPCPTLIASSSEVYGKSPKSPFHEDDDAVYGPTVVGRWSYACSKAVDEYLGLAYHRQHGVPVVIARFFNTVGPRQVGDYGMVLPRFVAAALAGRDLLVHGDGRQSRCFCDVRDVVRVLPRMLDAAACHGQVMNVGADTPVSIADLAATVIRVLGSSSGTRMIPYSDAYPAGFEDLSRRQPDLSRLRSAVGFAPAIPLERTILDLAAALREEPAR